MWNSIKPLLQAMADDPARFDRVTSLGVDEHVWHHVTEPTATGPRSKQLTGMVDLTRDADGKPRARLLDLVPGRSGKPTATGSTQRGEAFRGGVRVATLDPFHGYKNAIDDQLEDAVAVLDAFHVVKLGTQAVDEVRRRVQQEIHGHRGRKDDPLYGIRNDPALRRRAPHRPPARPARPRNRPPTNDTTRCSSPGSAPNSSGPPTTSQPAPPRAGGRREDPRGVPDLPDPRDRPARQDPQAVARGVPRPTSTPAGASNGGTEAVNGLIELHRRIARGFRNRDNYRLRMLLIGGGLTPPPQVGRARLS